MWSVEPVELSSNMRNRVSGVCGNYNGNPDDEDVHNDVTDILPHDNLFYSLELIAPSEKDKPFVDLTTRFDSYLKEQCEGEEQQSMAYRIYKRDGSQEYHDLVQDTPVSLVKRDPVSAESAREMCEEEVSSNGQLLTVSSLVAANPALVPYVTELEVLVNSAINACAFDVQKINEGAVEGMLSLC
jgi:hypothetical protein